MYIHTNTHLYIHTDKALFHIWVAASLFRHLFIRSQQDHLLWVDSNNYEFLWVTSIQNALQCMCRHERV